MTIPVILFLVKCFFWIGFFRLAYSFQLATGCYFQLLQRPNFLNNQPTWTNFGKYLFLRDFLFSSTTGEFNITSTAQQVFFVFHIVLWHFSNNFMNVVVDKNLGRMKFKLAGLIPFPNKTIPPWSLLYHEKIIFDTVRPMNECPVFFKVKYFL